MTRYSVYDAGGGLIQIDEVGGTKTEYIRAAGMTLARIAGSTVTWLHHDHLGSAVAGTNRSEDVSERRYAFGVCGVCRNSLQSIRLCTIISIISEISRGGPASNRYEMPPFANVANFSLCSACCPANSGDGSALD